MDQGHWKGQKADSGKACYLYGKTKQFGSTWQRILGASGKGKGGKGHLASLVLPSHLGLPGGRSKAGDVGSTGKHRPHPSTSHPSPQGRCPARTGANRLSARQHWQQRLTQNTMFEGTSTPLKQLLAVHNSLYNLCSSCSPSTRHRWNPIHGELDPSLVHWTCTQQDICNMSNHSPLLATFIQDRDRQSINLHASSNQSPLLDTFIHVYPRP